MKNLDSTSELLIHADPLMVLQQNEGEEGGAEYRLFVLDLGSLDAVIVVGTSGSVRVTLHAQLVPKGREWELEFTAPAPNALPQIKHRSKLQREAWVYGYLDAAD